MDNYGLSARRNSKELVSEYAAPCGSEPMTRHGGTITSIAPQRSRISRRLGPSLAARFVTLAAEIPEIATPQLSYSNNWKVVADRFNNFGDIRSSARTFLAWFTLYRRFFVLVVLVNIMVILSGGLEFIQSEAPTLATANVFAAVIIRNEWIVKGLHMAFAGTLWARRASLPTRLGFTSGLLYMGGLHSSFAVSGLIWLVCGLANAIRLSSMSTTSFTAGSSLAGLLAIICMLATRAIREKHHNTFEYTHRYLGWIGLALLWIFVCDQACYASDRIFGWAASLSTSPAAWFAAGTTILVVAPWLTVRRVPVKTYVPSQSVVTVRFAGGSDAGAFGRVSRGLLTDWHTFALVSERHARSHTMIIAALGDFTRGLIYKEPQHLYVRSVKFYGLPYSLKLYKRAVIVATGAGIAPFISVLLHSDSANYHVIWVGRAFSRTYGDHITQSVLRCPNLTTWDTQTQGRPDLLDLTARAYREFNAEAVFIGCNPEATRQLIYGCGALDIAAFGPSWDS